MIGKTAHVLREKLQDGHGDAMVEVLAAVFVAALGATMLAIMVTVSVTASTRSHQVLNASYSAEAGLFSSNPKTTSISVSIPAGPSGSVSSSVIAVVLYQLDGYEYYIEGRGL